MWWMLSAALAAPEVCNGVSDDEDGLIDEGPILAFPDHDQDGYGASAGAQAFVDCATIPAGWAPVGGDCADDDPARHPNADEACNGLDDDCDTDVDEGQLACVQCESLAATGFTALSCSNAIAAGGITAQCQQRGYDPMVFHSAAEMDDLSTYSRFDDRHWVGLRDIDPSDDREWVTWDDLAAPYLQFLPGEPSTPSTECAYYRRTPEGVGYGDAACANLALPFLCRSDCELRVRFEDNDGDGVGGVAQPLTCDATGSAVPGDCDDGDATIHPTATDVDGDDVDQDCDGFDGPLQPVEDTDTPQDTDLPVDTDVPEDTDAPIDTDVLDDTDAPLDTDSAADTDVSMDPDDRDGMATVPDPATQFSLACTTVAGPSGGYLLLLVLGLSRRRRPSR